MLELNLYLIEFKKNNIIKAKVYPIDCQIGDKNRKSIICIIHDEYIFSANNKFAWQIKDDIFLKPKRKKREIIIPDFLLFLDNLVYCIFLMTKFFFLKTIDLTKIKAVEIFEYRKNNNGY